MNILLLGGCGYIGTRLYDELSLEHEIVSVDCEWFGKTIDGNIKKDYNQLAPEFFLDFDAVILLAGHSSVAMCKNFIPAHVNNIDNFIDLLRKLPKSTKLIYASSSSVYSGLKNASEIDISFPPSCCYDLMKFEADMYSGISDKHFYGLRFGTVNGFSRNMRKDLMINSMYLSPEVHYSNPQISRPILAIKDLVEAVRVILKKGTYETRGFYNLASFNMTVDHIANAVSGYMKKGRILMPPSRTYDFSVDCSKFKRTFDFKFNGSVQSIVEDLKRIDSTCLIGERK